MQISIIATGTATRAAAPSALIVEPDITNVASKRASPAAKELSTALNAANAAETLVDKASEAEIAMTDPAARLVPATTSTLAAVSLKDTLQYLSCTPDAFTGHVIFSAHA